MSAMGAILPLRAPTDRTSGNSDRLSELGPITPELALVDPELARAARALLPGPSSADSPSADQPMGDPTEAPPVATETAVAPVTDQAALVERLRRSLEPVPEHVPPRRRARIGRRSAAAVVIAVVVPVAALAVHEWPAPATRQGLGQRQSTTPAGTTTTPTASSRPPRPPAATGETFVWVAAPKTAAYEFQLFRGGERVFRARVDEPRLELPARWRQGGRSQTLKPGSYRWYVWPISKRTKRRSSVAIVQAKLVIAGQQH
jgi:hypothetical protein